MTEGFGVQGSFDRREEPALLEADVVVEKPAESSGLLEGRLGGLEAERFAADRQVLFEHPPHAPALHLGVTGPARKQHLLLDAEVAPPVVVPELKKHTARLLEIVRLTQLLCDGQCAQVLARQRLEGLVPLHLSSVAGPQGSAEGVSHICLQNSLFIDTSSFWL